MSLPKPYYQDEAVTIYHGDAMEIVPLLAPVDLVLADPPYNVGKEYGDTSDNLLEVDYERLMAEIVTMCRRLAPSQAWVAPRYKMHLWWSLLPDAHEIVIPMRAGNAIRQGWSSKYSIVLTIGTPLNHADDLWEGIRQRGEGYFFRENTFGHPGYTPIPIMSRCISLLSSEDSVVFDPFMGTGTTLRAAKDLGRKAIGVEIEEKYCAIAAQRMSQEVLPLKLWAKS